MGNITGSLSAIADVYTRNAIKSLGLEFEKLSRTVSTIRRNNENVTSHATLTDLDYASAGHTGFASSAALTAHTSNTSNPHSTTLEQAITAGATATTEPTFNGGIDLGTSGRFDSNVSNAAAASNFLFKPTTTLTSGTDRYIFQVQDSSGAVGLSVASNGTIMSQASAHSTAVFTCGDNATTVPSSLYLGISFAPKWGATSGATLSGFSNAATAALFNAADTVSVTASTLIGGFFANALAARAHTNTIGGLFQAYNASPGGTSATAQGNIYGVYVKGVAAFAMSSTATAAYGIYVESAQSAATPASTYNYGIRIAEQNSSGATNKYGLFLDTATAGYKAIAIRDTNTYIHSSAAATLDFTATTVNCNGDFQVADTKNIILATGTGTKIGTGTTQKMAFYNTTPVAQYATTGTATGYTGGGGTALTHTDTFTGNTGATAYTIGDIVRALKLWGAIAA